MKDLTATLAGQIKQETILTSIKTTKIETHENQLRHSILNYLTVFKTQSNCFFFYFTAHNFVVSCKTKLMTRLGDIDELKRQLGECLYVVQSFYSNTNWVEMFGGVSYADFGKKNTIYCIREVMKLNKQTNKQKYKKP